MVLVNLTDGSIWEKNDTVLPESDFTEGVDAPAGIWVLIFYLTVTRGEVLTIMESSPTTGRWHAPYGFDLQTTAPADVSNNTLVAVTHMDGSRRKDKAIVKEDTHGNLEQATIVRDQLNYFEVNAAIKEDQTLAIKANSITGETVDVSDANNAFFIKLARMVREG